MEGSALDPGVWESQPHLVPVLVDLGRDHLRPGPLTPCCLSLDSPGALAAHHQLHTVTPGEQQRCLDIWVCEECVLFSLLKVHLLISVPARFSPGLGTQ